jgi:hypothetical protein
LWQSTMIALARSATLKRWAQGARSTSALATRYARRADTQRAQALPRRLVDNLNRLARLNHAA